MELIIKKNLTPKELALFNLRKKFEKLPTVTESLVTSLLREISDIDGLVHMNPGILAIALLIVKSTPDGSISPEILTKYTNSNAEFLLEKMENTSDNMEKIKEDVLRYTLKLYDYYRHE
jgi:hypothetical protein